jgi:DUF917 family protein
MAAYTPDGHGPQAATDSYADLIASDASNVHIIRTIECVNTDSAARNIFVSIGAGAAATEVLEVSVPANSTVTKNVFLKVPTSTAVQIKASVTDVVTVTIGGYHYA